MNGILYKIFGGLAVFFVAWLTRDTVCRESDGAEAQLAGYLTLFEGLRRGIAYERAPIDELLVRCEPSVLSACTGRVGRCRAESLAALCGQTEFLSEGLEEIVADAANRLGRGYHEEQLTACDRYIAALTALLAAYRKKREERRSVTGTLIYTVAAALVLLLL